MTARLPSRPTSTSDRAGAGRAASPRRGLETVAFGPFVGGAPITFSATTAASASWTRHSRRDGGQGDGFGSARAADFIMTAASTSTWPTTRPELPVSNEGGVSQARSPLSGAVLDEKGVAQASMGSRVGRDGDGVLDSFTITNSPRTSTLHHGLGGGCRDVSKASGGCRDQVAVAGHRSPTSTTTAPDLLVANGHIYPQIDKHPEPDRHVCAEDPLVSRTEPAGPALSATRRRPARPSACAYAAWRSATTTTTPAGRPADEPDSPPPPPQRGADGSWPTVACEGATASRTRQVRSSRSAPADAARQDTSGRLVPEHPRPAPPLGLGAAEKVDEPTSGWAHAHSRRRDLPAEGS